MTKNYFVLVEQPLYLSMLRLAWAHFVAGTYSDAMHWDANEKTRFHVVRRTDGKLMDTVYLSKGFFVFHHINAYEEDEHLVVDMCCYDEGEVINSLYVKALEELFSNPKLPSYPFVSRGKRYVLPLRKFGDNIDEKQNLVSLLNSEAKAYRLSGGSIFLQPETLSGSDPWCPELPRINYDYNGRKYKYYYALARKDETVDNVHLVKVDTVSRTTISWSEENVVPSEPVFIAEPNSVNEDSGVILTSLLYKDDETKVSMLVLNAKTMKEIGRVTFATNASVPGDFHGTFISKA
ncbi:Beta,beta-carotene 15,15'-monooxygenase, partial [Stegodyphus mimosarum]